MQPAQQLIRAVSNCNSKFYSGNISRLTTISSDPIGYDNSTHLQPCGFRLWTFGSHNGTGFFGPHYCSIPELYSPRRESEIRAYRWLDPTWIRYYFGLLTCIINVLLHACSIVIDCYSTPGNNYPRKKVKSPTPNPTAALDPRAHEIFLLLLRAKAESGLKEAKELMHLLAVLWCDLLPSHNFLVKYKCCIDYFRPDVGCLSNCSLFQKNPAIQWRLSVIPCKGQSKNLEGQPHEILTTHTSRPESDFPCNNA